MLDIARKLSAPFPFVRVDLYDIGGKPVFGELTFAPGGEHSAAAQKEMGELLHMERNGRSAELFRRRLYTAIPVKRFFGAIHVDS